METDQRSAAFADLFQKAIQHGSEGVILAEGGSKAAYSPGSHKISMPAKSMFKSERVWASVLVHEAIHSTGPRLGRCEATQVPSFGSEAYALEELVAELGAALTCEAFGLPQVKSMDDHHAAYLRSWQQQLGSDKGLDALRHAYRDAEAAFYDLHGKVLIYVSEVNPENIDEGDLPLAPEERAVAMLEATLQSVAKRYAPELTGAVESSATETADPTLEAPTRRGGSMRP